MNRIILKLAAVVLTCFCKPLWAQRANDECSNATLITTTTFGGSCSSMNSASTSGATRSLPSPLCTSENDDDVWFRFVAASQSVILRFGDATVTGAGTAATMGFAFYSECPTTNIALVCNNLGSAGAGYRIIDGLTIGNTYYLRFWSSLPAGSNADFEFCVQNVAAPPANDECNNAIAASVQPAIADCSGGVAASTIGATRSPLDPSCANGFNNDDIWYSFVATATGVRINIANGRIATLPTGNAFVGYALYEGTCPSTITSFSCDNNISSSGSALIGGLTPGTNYYLRFFSFGENNYMTFQFCLTAEDLPVNDDCNNAAAIPVSNGFCSTPVQSSLLNATTSAGFGAPSCASLSSTEDVWHNVIVPASGNVTIRTSTSDANITELVLEAYSGTCGSLTLITCSDDANNGPSAHSGATNFHPRIELTGRTPGETIYLRVLGKGTINDGPFSICAWDHTVMLPVSNSGNCTPINPVTINSVNGNKYMWVPLTDVAGHIVAEIFAKGNELGTINASAFINNTGLVRSLNGKFYLDRNIAISPTTNLSALVRLYYKQTELAALRAADPAIGSAADLQLVKTIANCQPALDAGGSLIPQQSNGSYGADYYIEFETPSFSSFYIDREVGALPVVLSAYTANCHEGRVTIEWTTATEIDHAFFSLERSSNGTDFETVSVISGNGSTSLEKNYRVVDSQILSGKQYYRLRQTDINGHQTFFKALMVDCGMNIGVKAFPNPFYDKIMLRGLEDWNGAQIELWSGTGILVKKTINGSLPLTSISISTESMPPGIYYLRIMTKDGRVRVLKMFKQ